MLNRVLAIKAAIILSGEGQAKVRIFLENENKNKTAERKMQKQNFSFLKMSFLGHYLTLSCLSCFKS
jgi:hypothetical protein